MFSSCEPQQASPGKGCRSGGVPLIWMGLCLMTHAAGLGYRDLPGIDDHTKNKTPIGLRVHE